MTAVTDPAGGQLIFSYNTASPLLITQVKRSTDGLSAKFQYTMGGGGSESNPGAAGHEVPARAEPGLVSYPGQSDPSYLNVLDAGASTTVSIETRLVDGGREPDFADHVQ